MGSEQRHEQTPCVVEEAGTETNPVRGRLDRPPGGPPLCVNLCRTLPGHCCAPQDAVCCQGTLETARAAPTSPALLRAPKAKPDLTRLPSKASVLRWK